MTYPVLLLAVALFFGTLAGVYKGYEAPRADVRAACGEVKAPADLDRELCASYGRNLK